MSTREKLAFFKYPFSKYPLKLSDTIVVGFAGNPPSDTCKGTPQASEICTSECSRKR